MQDMNKYALVINTALMLLSSFRLGLPVRPMRSWDCNWTVEDDSNLLLAIYEYGMGSWEQIQSDSYFKLDKKVSLRRMKI